MLKTVKFKLNFVRMPHILGTLWPSFSSQSPSAYALDAPQP